MLAPSAAAQTASSPLGPFALHLDQSVYWDSNVFRVPDSAADPVSTSGVTSRSDRSATTTFGVSFDKLYAQQRLIFDVRQAATRFEKFVSLDRNAFNYLASWQWHLTPRLAGVLSTDRSETVIGFDDTRQRQLNKVVTKNRTLNADWWVAGGWHLVAGAVRTERETTLIFFAVPSISQTGTEFGVRYDAASQSSIGLSRRSLAGTNTGQAVDLVNMIDSEFTVRETELRATWIASANSSVNGRLTRTERRNPHVPQRDFSGVGGQFDYNWSPTARLGVGITALRVLTPFLLLGGTTYRVDDTLAAAPTWRFNEKISLRMRLARVRNEFLGSVSAVPAANRRDVTRSLLFGADWRPHPKVLLSATLQRDRRGSSDPLFQYKDRSFVLTASLSF
jgi:exopolysaccharide biosynthesis operon protein EpsL